MKLRRFSLCALLVAAGLALGAHDTPIRLLPRLQRALAVSGIDLPARLSVSPDPARRAATGSPDALLRLQGAVSTVARNGGWEEARMVGALIDLAAPGASPVAADRAVAALEEAADADPSATVLADLSAAYRLRGQRGGGLLDLTRAVDAADRALALEPRHAGARYGLAIALEEMRLDAAAIQAWTRVLEVERGTGWAREAERRLARLRAPRAPWRSPSTPLARAAPGAPQTARVFAVDTLLAGWGAAVLRGDAAAADSFLARADTIGRALATEGGDHSAARMVAAIRAQAGDRAARRSLAAAHAAYARAQAELDWRDPRAILRFDTVIARSGRSPVLRQWAAYSRGLSLNYAGDPRAGSAFQALREPVDSVRLPVLAGRVRWSLATPLLRAGKYAEAREGFVAAQRLFHRAGEREHLGGALELEAEALFGLGETRTAYARLAHAQERLRPYDGSTWLHNLLYAAAGIASTQGLTRAALRLHEEDIAVAARQRPGVQLEAWLARARTLALAGEMGAAARDAAAADRLTDSVVPMSDGEREWMGQDQRIARALRRLETNPRSAAAELDSAVTFFATKSRARLVSALLLRAEARLRAGDEPGAVDDLERAAANRDSLNHNTIHTAAVRASIAEAGRRVFDRMAMVHVRAGRNAQALRALERGRAAFGGAGAASSADPVAPRGERVLDYALAGDTLLVFLVEGRDVHLARRTVDRRALLGQVARARQLLELRASVDSVRPVLAALHAALLGPLRARLPAGARLVVVADGELADVPFAALWDAERRRYLLQDHPIRFAPTLADASRRASPASASTRAFFVADPAFDAAAHPGLLRLTETGASVRVLAGQRPGARLLAEEAAGRDNVVAGMRGAGLVHFGGHAVFDGDRPADSYLLLAGRGPAGRLTAAEIERLDLRAVRMVVLSACQTQRSASGRAGGFTGLSGALLAAGAGGVVGSTWRVNEGNTRVLMEELYRAYTPAVHPADALRQAQLRLLASRDRALANPAAWAGFRYTGG